METAVPVFHWLQENFILRPSVPPPACSRFPPATSIHLEMFTGTRGEDPKLVVVHPFAMSSSRAGGERKKRKES
eukprot:86352-Hanusia_phi.AAC.1